MKYDGEKAFYGDQSLHSDWVAQLKRHRDADELIQGSGWEAGKGCFIGCSIHEYSRVKFAWKFNLPIFIGAIADSIFERLSNGEAQDFAMEIANSIKVGADYSLFYAKWSEWLILGSVVPRSRHESVQAVGDLFARQARGETIGRDTFRDAAAAAYAAAASYASYAAAADASYAAHAAYAAAAYAAAASYASYAAAAAASYAAHAAYAAAADVAAASYDSYASYAAAAYVPADAAAYASYAAYVAADAAADVAAASSYVAADVAGQKREFLSLLGGV